MSELDFGSDEREGIEGQAFDDVLHFDRGDLHVFSDGGLHALGRELVAHEWTHFFFDLDHRLFVVFRKAALATDLSDELLEAARDVVVDFGIVYDYGVNGRMVHQEFFENEFIEHFALTSVLALALEGFFHDAHVGLQNDLVAHHGDDPVGKHRLGERYGCGSEEKGKGSRKALG